MQTKQQSLIESIVNTVSGFIIALVCQSVVFPLFGIDISLSDNLKIVTLFMFVSTIRLFVIRRIFNRGELKQ